MSFSRKKDNDETVMIKSNALKSRCAILALGILVLIGTFAYSYQWSNRWHENVWAGLQYGYFDPFYIGTAIFLVSLAIHISFCRCRLVLTNKKIFGRASIIGNVTIPLEAVSSVSDEGNKVCVTINDKTIYKFRFISNAKQIVEGIQTQIEERQEIEEIHFEKPSLSYTKIVSLLLIVLAFVLVLHVCSGEGLFDFSSSSRSWSDLSDIEKENARWAYEAKQAINNYKK